VLLSTGSGSSLIAQVKTASAQVQRINRWFYLNKGSVNDVAERRQLKWRTHIAIKAGIGLLYSPSFLSITVLRTIRYLSFPLTVPISLTPSASRVYVDAGKHSTKGVSQSAIVPTDIYDERYY